MKRLALILIVIVSFSLPTTLEWPLFLVLSVQGLKVPEVIYLSIKIKDPDNNVTSEKNDFFIRDHGNILRIPWTNIFRFEITKNGVWVAEVSSGSLVLAKLPISVLVSN